MASNFALPLLRRSIHCTGLNHYNRTLEYMIAKLYTDTQTILRTLSSNYESDLSTSVVGSTVNSRAEGVGDIGLLGFLLVLGSGARALRVSFEGASKVYGCGFKGFGFWGFRPSALFLPA